ncbi:uncharacterized protein LOC130263043 [Oenanthe melanoleuca]|uniref:uncharacterized protein LOC130263043 n=1 Tax=Oenanthe melanoleuca TaxID=2939378 RepID=UPI0024C15BD8|nr:uncharacterized protein LOC130263043 [Oenanthe melanoleuca]
MGKRRTHPTGDRKFHAPKAKRILQEAPGAAGSAQSRDPNEDPAGMEPQASKNSSSEAAPDRILVAEDGPRSPQEGRNKEIGGSRALGSPKQDISKGMEENRLELPQLGILEVDGTEKDELESPKPGILDGAGENCPESSKLAILEVNGAGEEPPESVKMEIWDGMGQNNLESAQQGILEGDGAGEEPPASVKLEIWDGMGQNHLESAQLGILEGDGAGEEQLEPPQLRIPEADGAGEEPPESVKMEIWDGMGQNHLESAQQGILEGDGAGEEQLEPPQLRIPEADGAGEEPPEPVKLEIWDGRGEDQLEPSKPGIWEVVEAAEEQLETPTHRISDGAGEEPPESVKPGVSEANGEREEQLELLKEGIWDGAGENPEGGGSGAQGSSPEHTDTEVLQAGEGGALEQGCGTGIALSMDTGFPDHPRDPQSHGGEEESRNSPGGNCSVATAALDPAATSSQCQEQREGTSPELPGEKPWDTAGQIHTGSRGSSPAQPRESSARAAEPADASDIIHGLIRELSDLNRLAMGARRGLELLRRPKPRRGRRPAPGGTPWKEG